MYEIKRILHFVKPYRKLALLSLAMLLISVAADLSIPRLIEHIIDQGIRQNNLQVVLQTSVIMLGISILNTFAAVLNNNFSVRTGESTARDLREGIFVKIQQLSYGDLDRFSTGKLMVRLTSDASAVQRLVQVSLRIGTRAPLLGIGSLILMFITGRALAIAIVPLLLVTAVIIVFFSIKMEPLFRIVQQKLDRLNTVLQENIAGARLVKAFVRGEHEAERFKDANKELTDETVRVMQFMSSMSPLLTIFINIGVVLVVWYGGNLAIQGSLQIGQVVAFINYLLTTMTPLIMMTQLSNVWANGLASARRINEVLDAEPEVAQAPDAIPLPAHSLDRVDFENVAFHYRGNQSNGNGDLEVLEDINFHSEPGQTVALLGATGAGKSSLIKLIPRFYDVTRGAVTVADSDVRDLQEDSLLAQIGIVPQETILFSGTIRSNIAYGKPDASDEEVIAAARIAQAHDFIVNMPQGYQTHVEERGANLSGGQKQRIAIARAIITHPPILILDDATSAVDVETETLIQDALNRFDLHHTTFVVAQRISTVLNADKILVLDKGRIVAQGNHTELMQSSPIYREIYDSQLGNGLTEQEAQA
jgi:ATP-binding cassette subfamily B protein